MSGLFSFESLSLLLPAFILFKASKKPILHLAFPKYSPGQIEFQFIDLILKLVVVASVAAVVNLIRWRLMEPPNQISILALVMTVSLVGVVIKLSVDLSYLGLRNQVRGRSDPFVIIASFPTAIFILMKANHSSVREFNPIIFVALFVALFFSLNNAWLSELIEAKLDKPISNMEKVKSATKGYTPTTAGSNFSHQICRVIINGFSPLLLFLIVYVPVDQLVYFVSLQILSVSIFVISPSLSNSWTVVDSMKSPTIPLNQTSVLLRFFRLVFPAIIFWLIGVFGILVTSYSPSTVSSVNTDDVRADIERLVQTGEYLGAAKLIRGSELGSQAVMQLLPDSEKAGRILCSLASMCLTIHAVQTLSNVVIRRLKLELQKYM